MDCANDTVNISICLLIISQNHCVECWNMINVRVLLFNMRCVFSASMNFRLVNRVWVAFFSYVIIVSYVQIFLPLFYKIDFNKQSRRQTNMFLNLAWEYKSLTYFFVIRFDVSVSVSFLLYLYRTADFINDRIGHIIYTFIIVIQLVLNCFSDSLVSFFMLFFFGEGRV